MQIDIDKAMPLLGSVLNDMGAAANAVLVQTGDKLGLYAGLGIMTEASASELAKKTGTHERYVTEWLAAQATSGFVSYNAKTSKFYMTPEQAAVFADRENPLYKAGGFATLSALYANEPRLAEAFKSGKGVSWGDHCGCLFCGTEWSFRPGYKADLLPTWLPALEGVVDKLQGGAKVADVGCGHGASTLMMAQAFKHSDFVGFDYHEGSISHARRHVGCDLNIRYDVARADAYPGLDYDLVTMFDALHDMGDPVGVARHVLKTLKSDGTLMLVEPMAGDSLAENLNPVGRLFYAFSTSLCVPGAMSQQPKAVLGAQAGEKRLTAVLREAGFTRVRRVAETPINMVLEARP